MGNIFQQKKEISYYTTNNRYMLTKANLAMLLQDLAIDHSASIGYSLKHLEGIKRGWVITNWHIVFSRTPLCGEKITLKTWSNSCRRLMAERSYMAEDDRGETIIKAVSRWMYMDLENRKPAPITEEMEKRYYSGEEAAIEGEKYKMPRKPQRKGDFIEAVSVSRSQTDTNGHTNNTQYIAWAMDQVPDFIYDNMDGYDLKVVYRKESYRGEKMVLETYISKEENGDYLVDTYFVNGSDSSVIHCQVATLWKSAV